MCVFLILYIMHTGTVVLHSIEYTPVLVVMVEVAGGGGGGWA